MLFFFNSNFFDKIFSHGGQYWECPFDRHSQWTVSASTPTPTQGPASEAVTSLGDSLPSLPQLLVVPGWPSSLYGQSSFSNTGLSHSNISRKLTLVTAVCLQTPVLPSLFTSSLSLLPEPWLCSGNIACQVSFPSGNSTEIAEGRKRENSVGGSSPGRWPTLTNPRSLKSVSQGHVGWVHYGSLVLPVSRLGALEINLGKTVCTVLHG